MSMAVHSNSKSGPPAQPVIDEYIVRFARRRARELAGHHGFAFTDEADLSQQLLVDYLRRLPKYDRRKASIRTFGQRVINNHAASLVAAQKAKCRDYRLHQSLDELEVRGFEIALSREPDSIAKRQRSEMAEVIAGLPVRQRVIAKLISRTSVSEAARILGIPRLRVYRELTNMRASFAKAGFGPSNNRLIGASPIEP